MKAKIILSIALAVLLTSCAQSQWSKRINGNGNVITKTVHVGNYDEITVAGFFDVNLVSGKEGKLEIKIEDNLLPYLITEVVDGKLKIKVKKGINLSTKKGIFITVPFEDISAIKLAGSGDIVGEDTIKTDDFYTSVSGSGDITLKVNADTITSKITGSGDVTLIGNADNLKTSITGSGDFHGFKLKTQTVNAKVTGSGDVSVYASQKINARVTGSGDIDFMGNPEIQDTKVIGSGDINSKS